MLARASENEAGLLAHEGDEADLIEKVMDDEERYQFGRFDRHPASLSLAGFGMAHFHDAVCPANPACFSRMPQPCRNVKVRSGVRERVGVLVKADAPVPYLANLVLCNQEGGQCRLRGLEEADGLRGLREREVN